MKVSNQHTQSIRIIPYFIGTLGILSIPLIGAIVSDNISWSPIDFLTIGVLLLGAGLLYELIRVKVSNTKYRVIAAVLIIALVLYLWAELAVGIFTNWGS